MARLIWSATLVDFPRALAWAGPQVVVGLANGALARFDGTTGALLGQRLAHPGGVLALTSHPREPIVASAGEDGAVRFHRGGETIQVDPPGGGWAEHLAWSPGGKRLAGAQGTMVRIWSLDGRLLARSPALGSTVTGVAWSKDGRHVAAAGYRGVGVVDVASGALARRLACDASLLGVAWSPNGRFVAAGSQDQTVHLWRMPAGDGALISGFAAKPVRLSWSGDSSWLATTGTRDLTLWPFDGKGPEGREPLSLAAHDELVSVLAFAPRGKTLVSACRAGRVAIWSEVALAPEIIELGDEPEDAAWRPDGEVVALSTAGGRIVGIELGGDR
jgi:WD40 repeat protein